MSASFIPSLKHMTLAKTTIAICRDSEIRCFINELNFLWDKTAGEDKWKGLMDKAEEKINELPVPPQLHQCILALIKPISLEIARWKYDHLKILGDKFDFQSCRLFWAPEGTVDRKKTAEMLILNKNICIINRFFLACCYCRQNDVEEIWNIMCPTERILIYNEKDYYSNVIFWRSWLESKGAIVWVELLEQLLNRIYPDTICNYHKYLIWLRGFFDKLTTEQQKVGIWYTVIHTFKDHDNFRFCISQLNEEKRELVFKEYPLRLLRFFLDWPYQSLFSEAAEQMWKYLDKSDFRYLLYFIIYNRIVADWYDFDYVNLLKDFWWHSPKHLKDYIKNDTIYEAVKMVIYHEFPQHFPKEKIIQISFSVELPYSKFSLLREGDFL
ncbi:hypothetical protein HNY73_004208 [Argiope bruennichi]|uniref:Uncharacterized protein n=1 Tax=Argiope bruennichi TaxID=94029 RepID=A0A8T0FP54_ARGBR|nr:hypothetical protein HNY73_004208 [Argiope bruennichi]